MKRKSIAILLFFCLIGPMAGTYLWLQVKKAAVRKEVKQQLLEGIAEENLSVIRISSQHAHMLLWIDDHEFEYQNEMYDVVRAETDGNTTKYLCWKDQKESNLNHELSILLARRMNRNRQQKKQKERLSDFYKSLYTNTSQQSQSSLYSAVSYSFYRNIIFTSITSPPPVPPPKAHLIIT